MSFWLIYTQYYFKIIQVNMQNYVQYENDRLKYERTNFIYRNV